MNLKDRLIYTYARLCGKKRFFKLNFLLLRLGLSGMGVMNYQDHYISGENWLKEKVLSSLVPKIVFDVGCNEGDYIASFAREGVECHCFEPIPSTYTRLSSRFESFENVKVVNKALSDAAGTATMYDYSEGQGSSHASLYKEHISKENEVTSTQVEVATLDSYMSENNISEIDFLKVDTEGNEFLVFDGAREALEKGKIKVIQFEFSYLNRSTNRYFVDFFHLMAEYKLYRLLPKGLLRLDTSQQAIIYEQYGFQNVVAIRNDLELS